MISFHLLKVNNRFIFCMSTVKKTIWCSSILSSMILSSFITNYFSDYNSKSIIESAITQINIPDKELLLIQYREDLKDEYDIATVIEIPTVPIYSEVVPDYGSVEVELVLTPKYIYSTDVVYGDTKHKSAADKLELINLTSVASKEQTQSLNSLISNLNNSF